jgi:hypothetical protein
MDDLLLDSCEDEVKEDEQISTSGLPELGSSATNPVLK